ncbi:hypothetical protein N7495_006808 [Penicillium taxi]|uniref:uncharacterized protein n=1 Tax=Penicillium taxi TaxID=168475 RepID=UPI002545BC6A|nr:uncharacterized protein N7495_006808 [Penicillium taxi]KAJ5895117.1 hypothetical protein N7495_006808 [Penicillium taxi]
MTTENMGVPQHSFDLLEERRLELEDNILQLQKSLYYWRTWEAEYDELREEISDLHDYATIQDIATVGKEFGGSLVDAKEVKEILEYKGAPRSRVQIVNLLGRRIDYVKQNVATMEKRFRAAEDELYAFNEDDQARIIEGTSFPMREILEELDEDGEVISSTIKTPGEQAPELLELLKKAGVDDIPDTTEAATSDIKPAAAVPEVKDDTPDVATHPEPQTNQTTNEQAPTSNTIVSPIVVEPDLDQPVSLVTDDERSQEPVTNAEETVYEAALRREMFQYGINEIGAIVAELELDEDGSEFSVEDETDEEDDDFGRSHVVLSDEYIQQMRELEAKLNARGMSNMGKDTQTFPEEVRQEIETSAAAETSEPVETAPDSINGKKAKKRVAFADDLDIAPTTESPAVAETKMLPPQAQVQVLLESIVERTDQKPEIQGPSTVAPKKVSRFKSARSSEISAKPTGGPSTEAAVKPSKVSETVTVRKLINAVPSATPPALFPATPNEPKPFSTPITENFEDENPSVAHPPEGMTLADNLVEREFAPGAARAPEPNELDPEIHRREIASEFYQIRNRMIKNKGGFVNDDEAEMVPIDIEDKPRVSKFKAARMG